MSRRFNITGPCVPGRDFMVPLGSRLEKPLSAIRRGESLMLVRARQSGKTTLLRELCRSLQRESFAVALCAMQLAEDQSLTGMYRHIEASLRQAFPVPTLAKWTPQEPQSLSFCLWLGEAQRQLGRPLVLILDEYDAPPRKLVTAMLRSFRAALTLSEETRPFVHSLTICGKTHVRELRDELRPAGDETRGSGSLWNVALPLSLPPWSSREVDGLLDDYTAESGVPFSRAARAELYAQTRGQPWLVSRVCYQLDEQLGQPRVSAAPGGAPGGATGGLSGDLAPTPTTVRAAVTHLLDEDQVHLLGVSDLLQNRREAQEIVLRLLSGEELPLSRVNEAQSYLLDVGLVVPSESRRLIELLCPIYATYLGRWLAERAL